MHFEKVSDMCADVLRVRCVTVVSRDFYDVTEYPIKSRELQ